MHTVLAHPDKTRATLYQKRAQEFLKASAQRQRRWQRPVLKPLSPNPGAPARENR
jgi:hypothetical protein